MATVRLEKVSRKFNNTYAICDINFEVPDGEFWVLVGPSGCGKSTILRSIAGLEAITEGKLYFDGNLVNGVRARQRDVAMVFQNYALYPHLTVAENIGFGLKMRGLNPKIVHQKVSAIAYALNIEHLLARKPRQLSGGQQQRVALGRAIIREPKVFLLDEPLSNLDAQLREAMRTELKKLHNQIGITTIYVTHDQIEAMTLADRIVVLDRGMIQQIGSPQEIYTQPKNKMVASFLGSPPMNIFSATYSDQKLAINERQFIPLERKHVLEKLRPKTGQVFDLGIRPEFIRILDRTGNSYLENMAPLQVQIDLVEPLGRETLVRALIVGSESEINFLTDFNWQGKRGDVVSVALDMNQLLFFDPRLEIRL